MISKHKESIEDRAQATVKTLLLSRHGMVRLTSEHTNSSDLIENSRVVSQQSFEALSKLTGDAEAHQFLKDGGWRSSIMTSGVSVVSSDQKNILQGVDPKTYNTSLIAIQSYTHLAAEGDLLLDLQQDLQHEKSDNPEQQKHALAVINTLQQQTQGGINNLHDLCQNLYQQGSLNIDPDSGSIIGKIFSHNQSLRQEVSKLQSSEIKDKVASDMMPIDEMMKVTEKVWDSYPAIQKRLLNNAVKNLKPQQSSEKMDTFLDLLLDTIKDGYPHNIQEHMGVMKITMSVMSPEFFRNQVENAVTDALRHIDKSLPENSKLTPPSLNQGRSL